MARATAAVATTNTALATGVTGTAATTSINYSAYLGQTGIIRQAPPVARVGSSITVNWKTASPLFPTSSYSIYTTFADPPIAQTTTTPDHTWTVTSYENGLPPASIASSWTA